jgi:hypothetical protein
MRTTLFFILVLNAVGGFTQAKPVYKSFTDTVFVKGDRIPAPALLFYDHGLSEKFNDSLAVIAQFLKKHPSFEVEIGYYTDYRGHDLYNKKLSIARAQQIVQKLSDGFGIPIKQIVPYGYGEEKLMYTEEQIRVVTDKEKAENMHLKNQRCEIKILGTGVK